MLLVVDQRLPITRLLPDKKFRNSAQIFSLSIENLVGEAR